MDIFFFCVIGYCSVTMLNYYNHSSALLTSITQLRSYRVTPQFLLKIFPLNQMSQESS